MALLLLIAIIGLPIAEIAVFIQAGDLIGVGPTIGLILLTAVLGTVLLRAQGMRTLNRARASLDRGELPVGEVFEGLCLLMAGALLLTPGFITDTMGLLLFIPPVRDVIGRAMLGALMKRGSTRVWVAGGKAGTPGGRGRPGGGSRGAPEDGPRGGPKGGVVIDADYTEIRSDDGPADDGPTDDGRADRGPGARLEKVDDRPDDHDDKRGDLPREDSPWRGSGERDR